MLWQVSPSFRFSLGDSSDLRSDGVFVPDGWYQQLMAFFAIKFIPVPLELFCPLGEMWLGDVQCCKSCLSHPKSRSGITIKCVIKDSLDLNSVRNLSRPRTLFVLMIFIKSHSKSILIQRTIRVENSYKYISVQTKKHLIFTTNSSLLELTLFRLPQSLMKIIFAYNICWIVCLVLVNLLLAQQWYFKTEITHRVYHLIASLDLFALLTPHLQGIRRRIRRREKL